ncbi:hypothetical protein CANCADRAFT_83583 [Tortispora caseinolytica NRRL Y-17796]|uniref:ATP-dependent 6-phosphofructokinase n=1 Tax=Tortispora caseinolytica NRRL Y-17796 TaxID=767744 RepID=A0A1E4TKB2_9ASCO|nr:hypothetical protein CANCADRAFT_83583 [Tortispora caseinolytica NRRL Y-17796]
MVSNLVDSTSFLSFPTNSEETYHKAIDFYKKLGFEVTQEWDVSHPALHRTAEQSAESVKESWMLAISGESSVTIKIRLTKGALTQEIPGKVPDFRAIEPSFVLRTSEMEEVRNLLNSLDAPLQGFPNLEFPIELYTIDPLGNVIGFTIHTTGVSAAPVASQASTPNQSHGYLSSRASVTSFSAKKKKIGIMTSGGDSPGMSAAVRAVVRTAIYRGCEAYAIYDGYNGLVQGKSGIKKMEWQDVRGWLSEGGTLIGTARNAEFRERSGRLKAAKNLIDNGIDALIICGGDGSLTGADLFRSEWPGLLEELIATGQVTEEACKDKETLTIAGLVGSIDNDMAETDVTIGAYSSLARICQMVDYIDTTAQSHARAFVIEVMGRHCGWLALMSGLATNADFIFIPERPVPHGEDWSKEMRETVLRHRRKGKRKTVIIVAEGAIDDDLQPVTATMVQKVLSDDLKLDCRITTLGHVQRGGPPCAYDRMLATLQGYDAVDAVLSASPDVPSPVISIRENKICRTPLMEAVALTKSVATAIKKKDFDTAVSLRNSDFQDSYKFFKLINNCEDPANKVPEDKRLNIAIINVGAPAGGMNAAVRAAAIYCFARGHKPYGIYNGFTGLVRHDSVKEFDWLDLDRWATKGGSEIGTNRNTPDVDMGMVAFYFQKYHFDGLMIVGGFEAFTSLHQLFKAREFYPSLRIPMVCLPATISNNVPGSEYSLGSDTCLNALVEYCDVIKQSASASRRRVFVVEVQGGNSGYIASYSGLVTGAVAVYTPEEGITLETLAEDIGRIKNSFYTDQGENRAGKLIIRNERSSSLFSTEFIAAAIKEEGNGKFEARTAIPGHVQQGGMPSPIDRVRAIGLAVQCVKFLEDMQADPQEILANSETAAVLGIKGIRRVFSPVDKLYEFDTELKWRRPLSRHWYTMKGVGDMLASFPSDL